MTKKTEMAARALACEAKSVLAVADSLSVNPDYSAATLRQAAEAGTESMRDWLNGFMRDDPRACLRFLTAARLARESGDMVDQLVGLMSEQEADHAE